MDDEDLLLGMSVCRMFLAFLVMVVHLSPSPQVAIYSPLPALGPSGWATVPTKVRTQRQFSLVKML